MSTAIEVTKAPHKSKTQVPVARKIARVTGLVIARTLEVIAIFALGLPIILLPISTSVPPWVWIPLDIVAVALIVLQFRVMPPWKGITTGLVGMALASLIAIFVSQAYAMTPPITDANGQMIPNSIASLEKVTINGTEQWITIRGHDENNPILLNLGMGGPGGGGFSTRSLFEPLEKDYVVVAWDEPGTGKSYHAVPISTLNKERFVEDAHALTLYLRERFHQEKIYVYGTSWTSILGVWLVQEYPELYYAYIGNAQMVNTTENDILGYELAIDYLTKKGDTKTLETLRRSGPPPYTGENVTGRYVAYLDVLQEYMGMPRFTLIVPIVPFFAPEYGYVDKINHTRGLIESFDVVYPQLAGLDFTAQAPKLDVPVYLFAGRNDVNAMYTIVEEYFNVLEAPRKELTWLEGGHGLDASNLGQFVDVMLNSVISETYPTK